MMINGMLKGGAPLLGTTFAGKTGVADPQNAMNSTLEWGRKTKVDVAALRPYAQAVYKASDDYVGSLKEEDLKREIDLSQWNMGKWALDAFLVSLI